MVRKLMWIVGLSLTVAAFGCSDDSGGSAGSGGSGGDGGTGGATGACDNAADTAIICESTFPADVTACGTEFFGEGSEAISVCVAENTGVSGECATCFGDTTECTIDNCLTDCAVDQTSQACTDCREENCGPAFNACAGDYDCGGAGGSGGAGGAGGMGGSSGAGGMGGSGAV